MYNVTIIVAWILEKAIPFLKNKRNIISKSCQEFWSKGCGVSMVLWKRRRDLVRYHALTADLIQNAGHTARRFGHSYVGSAHLLVALTELPGGTGQFLRGLGIES